MTALQDWLSNRPTDPRTLKTLIRHAIKELSPDEPALAVAPVPATAPVVMSRGLERC
jgi:hypothetical protein